MSKVVVEGRGLFPGGEIPTTLEEGLFRFFPLVTNCTVGVVGRAGSDDGVVSVVTTTLVGAAPPDKTLVVLLIPEMAIALLFVGVLDEGVATDEGATPPLLVLFCWMM